MNKPITKQDIHELHKQQINTGLTEVLNYPADFYKLFSGEVSAEEYQEAMHRGNTHDNDKSANRLFGALDVALKKEHLYQPLTIKYIQDIHKALSENLDDFQIVTNHHLSYPGHFRETGIYRYINGFRRTHFRLEKRHLDLMDAEDKERLIVDAKAVGASVCEDISRGVNVSIKTLKKGDINNWNNRHIIIAGAHADNIWYQVEKTIFEHNKAIEKAEIAFLKADDPDNSTYQEDVLLIVCKTVRRLMLIHPFPDMNGRTLSKILLTSLLAKYGLKQPVSLQDHYILGFCRPKKIRNIINNSLLVSEEDERREESISFMKSYSNINHNVDDENEEFKNDKQNDIQVDSYSEELKKVKGSIQESLSNNDDIVVSGYQAAYYTSMVRITLKYLCYPLYYIFNTIGYSYHRNERLYTFFLIFSSLLGASTFTYGAYVYLTDNNIMSKKTTTCALYIACIVIVGMLVNALLVRICQAYIELYLQKNKEFAFFNEKKTSRNTTKKYASYILDGWVIATVLFMIAYIPAIAVGEIFGSIQNMFILHGWRHKLKPFVIVPLAGVMIYGIIQLINNDFYISHYGKGNDFLNHHSKYKIAFQVISIFITSLCAILIVNKVSTYYDRLVNRNKKQDKLFNDFQKVNKSFNQFSRLGSNVSLFGSHSYYQKQTLKRLWSDYEKSPSNNKNTLVNFMNRYLKYLPNDNRANDGFSDYSIRYSMSTQ